MSTQFAPASDETKANIWQYIDQKIPYLDREETCKLFSRLDLAEMNKFFGFKVPMDYIRQTYEGFKDAVDSQYPACMPIEEMEFTDNHMVIMQWRIAADF